MDYFPCVTVQTPDPMISSRLFIENSTELHLLSYQVMPLVTGTYTELGKHIVENWTVKEVFIDSTFKTNRQRLELFAVIETVLCTGFLIAYFLLEPATSGGYSTREKSLSIF